MSFTDKDIKRFDYQIYDKRDTESVNISVQDFKALLARLEAAEKIVELYLEDYDDTTNSAIQAWRKAAGK